MADLLLPFPLSPALASLRLPQLWGPGSASLTQSPSLSLDKMSVIGSASEGPFWLSASVVRAGHTHPHTHPHTHTHTPAHSSVTWAWLGGGGLLFPSPGRSPLKFS